MKQRAKMEVRQLLAKALDCVRGSHASRQNFDIYICFHSSLKSLVHLVPAVEQTVSLCSTCV